MSEMDPVRWRELSVFLNQALDLPGTDRLAWLEKLRSQHPRVADELKPLLGRLDSLERSRFLEDEPALVFKQPPLAGQILGAYTLESMIGHGGMGSVWLARRSDGRFEGQAAVK